MTQAVYYEKMHCSCKNHEGTDVGVVTEHDFDGCTCNVSGGGHRPLVFAVKRCLVEVRHR